MSFDDSTPSSVADWAALGQLLEEHRPRLLAMLRRRIDPKLSVRLDAEEVLSEAFLQARRRWMAFQRRPEMKPYPWLYRITLDCLIEAWRHQTRDCRDLHRDMPLPEGTSLQLGLGLMQPGTSPSEALNREELIQRMQQTLALLKEGDREILLMRSNDDLKFPEIGNILGVSENTATVRYARALRRLRELWKKLYENET